MINIPSLTLRVAETRDDALAILEVLKEMHDEVGRAPLNDHKAYVNIGLAIQAGGVCVVESGAGIVGTYGLTKDPWWFSDEVAYFSMWFFVVKEYRNGRVARQLLEHIADRVEEEDVPAYVHIYDARDRGASSVRRIAEEVGFVPSGRIMILQPKAA